MEPAAHRDGHPDMQGYWTNDTYTPLERPAELAGKEFFTPEEAAAFVKSRLDRLTASRATTSTTTTRSGRRRTTPRSEPPDVAHRRAARRQAPAADARGQARVAPSKARSGGGPADSAQSRSLAERCISWGNVGPPMMPPTYNANLQILQSRDHVIMRHEMMHDVRDLHLDGRPHPGRAVQLAGRPLARAAGKATRWSSIRPTSPTRRTSGLAAEHAPGHLRERVAARGRALHARRPRTRCATQFTVEDPATWTRPWSGEMPIRRFDGPIYEYACHEGNYGLANILRAARVQEASRQRRRRPRPSTASLRSNPCPRALVLGAAAMLFAAFGMAFAVAPRRLAALGRHPAADEHGHDRLHRHLRRVRNRLRDLPLHLPGPGPSAYSLGLLASGWAVTGFAVTRSHRACSCLAARSR